MLEVTGLGRSFGGLRAVDAVSLSVNKGQLVGLFGPNGAGKTTFFNLVSGALKADTGTVLLDGDNVTHYPAHKRAQRGMARTFQVVKPLPHLSVMDNIMVPLSHVQLRHWLPLRRYRTVNRQQKARQLLEKVGLDDKANEPAHALPLGLKKRLEVARAMALEPKVLLLDEPLAGLTLTDARQLLGVISEVAERGSVATLLIEHNVRLAMAACDYAVVMEAGQVIASGDPEVVKRDPKVIAAYLGQEAEDA